MPRKNQPKSTPAPKPASTPKPTPPPLTPAQKTQMRRDSIPGDDCMPRKNQPKSTPAPKPAPPPLTPAQKTKLRLAEIPGLVLFDDVFMRQVFSDNIPAAQCLINIILGRTDLRVESVQTQYTISNLRGRGVCLDIFCKDSIGRLFNVEVQNPSKGAHPKRARYNSAVMDTSNALVGDQFENLPETYVIFITREDYFGEGDPIYRIDRTLTKYNRLFGDEAHIIYVNGTYTGNDAVGKLMHDFHCTKASDMNYHVLAERVQYLKETRGGQEQMCEAMQKLFNVELYDYRVNDKIQVIQMLMDKYKSSFTKAFEDAGVDPDIAPAVKQAFGMTP